MRKIIKLALSMDQGLKNNSRVTLINTNVIRKGSDYDANVSVLEWDLYDNQVNQRTRYLGNSPLLC